MLGSLDIGQMCRVDILALVFHNLEICPGILAGMVAVDNLDICLRMEHHIFVVAVVAVVVLSLEFDSLDTFLQCLELQ